MAGVVGVACQDCTGAVELFCEDQAGEIVGHCDGAKRERETRGGVDRGVSGGRPAIRWADREDDVLDSLVAPVSQPGGKFCGRKLTAAAIEEDRERGEAGRFSELSGIGKPGEKCGFRWESFGLARQVGVNAVEVDARKSVVLGFRV